MAVAASLKARRMLAEQRVMPAGTAAAYNVEGDHGSYRVLLGAGWTSCSCPALRELCSHVESALILHAALVAEGLAASQGSAARGSTASAVQSGQSHRPGEGSASARLAGAPLLREATS